MSGPYCKTCNHYRPHLIGEGGECGDPSKIISVGKGDVVNSPPEVRPDWECPNHTGLKKNEAEIRAQRDREIADWLDGRAELWSDYVDINTEGSFIEGHVEEARDAANELRQRAGE